MPLPYPQTLDLPEKYHQGTNTLAYFASTKKKSFCNIAARTMKFVEKKFPTKKSLSDLFRIVASST
jgi:hypothetical protein